MSSKSSVWLQKIDLNLVVPLVLIMMAGLVTMSSFNGQDLYFVKQGSWIIISLLAFFIASSCEYRFLKQTRVVMCIYGILIFILILLFGLGHVAKGAESWFRIGGFAFQPSDLMKLGLIIVLAKYFSRRHIEIANIRHIVVSAVYACIPFVLVLLQPDFGSAMVLFFIWFGMVFVSGISLRHVLLVVTLGVVSLLLAWNFAFKPYQKARIITFINPLHDIRGSGYNAYQSTIAVGSGVVVGKGLGYGTQSRLNFLPEHRTDFIFAAYAEEWGFVGSMLVLICFLIIFLTLAYYAYIAYSPFEALFTYGVVVWFMTHTIINIGMNIGVMPVTGIPLPFMSYGGSHLLAECIALGICVGMRRYSQEGHGYHARNEFVGLE